MILSRKFVSDYIKLDMSTKELADKMVKIGNEYDKVSKLISATNLTLGEVISCENHPESDHLHICKVNIGKEVLNIICGAPNVRKDIKVIVALDGAILPGGSIKKTKILGCESNGMICSLNELGIDNKFLKEEDIKGIHELDKDAPIGEDPIKYMELDDEIIDFELTSNRGDLLSMLGLSYEVGAIINEKVNEPNCDYKSNEKDINKLLKLNVNTENTYTFLVKRVDNIIIKDSPLFIRNRLISCGIRPINNVVDISNYIMLETGQPLHFYDADKLGKCIGTRMAKNGETIKTLDDKIRILTNEDIIIVNDKDEAIGLAGVMGGYSTEIDENTKNVVIESAIFKPFNIRYTAIKHLKSEASNRFEKGLDVNRTYLAIERSCKLLNDYANGSVCKGVLEYNSLSKDDKCINITLNKINLVLGLKLTKEEVIDVFNKLEFNVKCNKEAFEVNVPSRRIDISIEEDLIEEIGRIYGVDNIEGTLPYFETEVPFYDNRIKIIRDKVISLGLSEVKTYSLINEKDIFKFTSDEFGLIKIKDPMTEERVVLRHSLINSLLEVYNYNKSRNNKDLSIFEINKGFSLIDGNYIEENKLCGLLVGDYNLGINNEKVDFYVVKGIIEETLNYLGYENRYSFINGEFPAEMHPTKTLFININGKNVGFFGEVHPNISKDEIYVFEINLDYLLDIKTGKIKYKEYSKYPSVSKDLAFILSRDINSLDVINTIRKSGGRFLTNIDVFDYYEGDKIDKNKKSIAYSLTFESYDKTLSDEEINPMLNKIIENVIKNHNGILRDK